MIVNYRRYCTAGKCKTGRNSDRQKRKKLGLRQLSLFHVPKDLTLRIKWSEILGQTLDDRDSVCELHFPPDAIDKYHRTLLSNGEVREIERLRYVLKPEALPMRIGLGGEDNDTADDTGPNCLKLEIVGSHSLIIPDPNIKEYQAKRTPEDQIKELLSLSDVNIGLTETIGSSVNEIDLTDLGPNSRKLEDSSLQKDNTPNVDDGMQSTDSEVPLIQTEPQYDHCYYVKSFAVEGSRPQKNIEEKVQNSIENVLPVQTDEIEHSYQQPSIVEKTSIEQDLFCHSTQTPLTLQLNPKQYVPRKMASTPTNNGPLLQINQKQNCKKRKIESVQSTEALQTQKFSLYTIRDYFVKNPLPKSWTWIESKKFDAIIFVQISRATQHIRCYVECKENLSIQVSTFDRHIIYQLDTVVTSIDDVLNLLLKVYNLRLCEANIVNETRSENCSLVLNEQEMRMRKLPIDRCTNCRNDKKPRSKYFSELKTRVDIDKNRDLSQKLYQMTKSCEHYREKCQHMKEMLQNLKKLCVTTQNTAKKTALDEAINELPGIQQEVVRACFDNAHIDPRARRYEANYTYECFLLQAVSDAAYDHIKQRNLLPLPCKKTLKRTVGKESKT